MKQIINYVIANVIIPFVVYRKTQNEKELTSLESILSDSVRSLGLTLYSVPNGYAIYGITMANFTIEGGSNQLMCCLN